LTADLPGATTSSFIKMYWLLGRQSKLTTSSKLLAYKVVLKPIWTYGLQLWGMAYTSNIEILDRFQSKALRMITDAPWYVTNALLRRDLHIPSVKEEIYGLSSQYSARLNSHPNLLTANLKKQPTNRRLRRILPTDLPTRVLV
jgi:carbonic anhydrase